jgi:protoporphyrinogen IX oxidase
MLCVKSLHIVFMVTWFAGLFYLPRLFVYHAMTSEATSIARFKVMERKLYNGIMTPGALLTIVFGSWLWLGYGVGAGTLWMLAKLMLVLLLVGYHFYCGLLMRDFKRDQNTKSHVWLRWFNEAPVVILLGVVFLVVVKPF